MKRLMLSSSMIIVAVFLLDQATKYYVKAKLGYFDVITVTSYFNIVYAENTGSAFGMFKELGPYFFIIMTLAAVILIAVMIVKDRDNRAAYSLLLGGAQAIFLTEFCTAM